MVSKKSCEIVNKLNIPMLIHEYQTDHTCISVCMRPVLYHADNWNIRFSVPCQDPYDGCRLKEVRIEREFNPIAEELFLETEVRGWIEELLDFVDRVQKGQAKISDNDTLY